MKQSKNKQTKQANKTLRKTNKQTERIQRTFFPVALYRMASFPGVEMRQFLVFAQQPLELSKQKGLFKQKQVET